MVSPGIDKTRWPSLNIPGAMVVLPTWQCLTRPERHGGPASHLHSDGSGFFLIASIQNAVHEVPWWLQSNFCDLCYRTFHMAPKDGQFQPATRLQKLSSLIALCVFQSHSSCVILAMIFFSGCKCHAVKLELSTLSEVLPKE